MSSSGGERPDSQDPGSGLAHKEFVAGLEVFERVLLEVKDKLYEGSWEKMESDLQARLSNKPYIFKLSQTINRDLEALKKMRAYEQQHGVDLSKVE